MKAEVQLLPLFHGQRLFSQFDPLMLAEQEMGPYVCISPLNAVWHFKAFLGTRICINSGFQYSLQLFNSLKNAIFYKKTQNHVCYYMYIF